jgi:hypothetical protein
VADGKLVNAQQRSWKCLVVPGSHGAGDGAAVPGLVAQQRGWPHRAGGDGGDALHWSDVTVLSRAGAGLKSAPLSRVPPSSLEGATCRPYRSGRHSVTELTLALPYSSRAVPGMASQGGLAEQRRDMIHRWCPRVGVERICL